MGSGTSKFHSKTPVSPAIPQAPEPPAIKQPVVSAIPEIPSQEVALASVALTKTPELNTPSGVVSAIPTPITALGTVPAIPEPVSQATAPTAPTGIVAPTATEVPLKLQQTMPRKFFIGGNWKMNGSKALAQTLVAALNDLPEDPNTEIVISPPFPYLDIVRKSLKSTVGVSAQNIYAQKSGAYTGETSVEFLKDLDIGWVILGHSERREYFKESDEEVAKKVAFSIENGVSVIACIGEKLDEREANETTAVVTRQLKAIADHVKDWSKVVIAYEPVWAIGTGKVATPAQAQEVHAEIRTWLTNNVSPAVAESTRILYGGSVNAGNCKDLAVLCSDIDGFLVGGASLKAPDFLSICKTKVA